MTHDDERGMLVFWGGVFLCITLGVLAGVHLNFWAFSFMVILCIAVARFFDEDTLVLITVYSIATWLVGVVAWYFATGQHWIGDFVKEFVLR